MELHPNIERVLFTAEEMKKRTIEIGEQISRDYEGREIYMVGILKGAVVFFADLLRSITVPVKIDFMAISSYGASAQTSGVVRILKDLEHDIQGLDVLIVEDIIDTGLTLGFLKENLISRGAHSLKIATLLDKPERRRVEMVADYVGERIPDEFVVGYGFDYGEHYRNLPYVGVLKREVYM